MSLTGGLFSLIKTGNLGDLKRSVSSRTPLDDADGEGMTLLHWAAQIGNAEIVAFLVAKGADIHRRDHAGKSPLLHAAEYGQVAAAKVLLDRGATPAVRAKTSETALHLAVRCWSPPFEPQRQMHDGQGMTELLAQHKYLLDYRLDDGRTALMIAAADENAGMMRALIKAGADPDLKDDAGRTATDWARERGADYTLQVLLAREAAREARGGLTKEVLVGHALKLKNPKF